MNELDLQFPELNECGEYCGDCSESCLHEDVKVPSSRWYADYNDEDDSGASALDGVTFWIANDNIKNGTEYSPLTLYFNVANAPKRPAKWEDFKFDRGYVLDNDGDDYNEADLSLNISDYDIPSKVRNQLVKLYNEYDRLDERCNRKHLHESMIAVGFIHDLEELCKKYAIDDTVKQGLMDVIDDYDEPDFSIPKRWSSINTVDDSHISDDEQELKKSLGDIVNRWDKIQDEDGELASNEGWGSILKR